ncbi:MAG: M23 family metallopeptidase [Nannocystaceae bacterium]|nr:M23 family metallopeptidase [bacterium]
MPPAASIRTRSALLLLCLATGCGTPSSEEPPPPEPPAPEPAEPAEARPALPPPPEDPWSAEGLAALRNGDDLGWPVEAVHVTSSFGWRVDPVEGSATRLHRGTDFRGEVGDLVLSIAAGQVTFVGHDPVLGTMVVVDHGLGITSLYGHLSDALVWPGASLQRGAALGLVGNTGRSAAPHLHLTIKIDDVAVDPMMLLGQPLHRATALRGTPPRTREPVEPEQARDGDDLQSAPVLQP